MSMHIPQEKLDNPELLTEAEIWYIWTRTPHKLPAGVEPPTEAPDREDPPVQQTKVTPLEEQMVPTIGDKGGIVDDEEEDYEEGWNNDQRRAELARRGLSIDGKKEDLVARLRRADTNTLEEDDQSTVG